MNPIALFFYGSFTFQILTKSYEYFCFQLFLKQCLFCKDTKNIFHALLTPQLTIFNVIELILNSGYHMLDRKMLEFISSLKIKVMKPKLKHEIA